MTKPRFEVNAAAMRQVDVAFAHGLLNVGYAIERDAKREAPVRGGHRSFAPDGPVGGTLRRSIHTAAFLDGERIGGSGNDENGEPEADYPAGSGAQVFVGTNVGYGRYVELGTVKMPARPFLTPALLARRQDAPQLIAAGMRKHLRGQ